jgi:hypothetical protein
MRRLSFALFSLALCSGPALAGRSIPPPQSPPPQKAAQLPTTRIETDQQTGTIRFIVKGKEAATFDATGLHVRNNIDYAGTLSDI